MAGDNSDNIIEERVARALDRAGLAYVHSTMIGPYEVDFRLGKRVIIEVDGYTHLTISGRGRDEAKDRYLRELGYEVLRITGDQVHSPELTRFIDRVRLAVKAERAENESDRTPSPFADPKLESLRQRLADSEAKASAAPPPPKEPDDDSDLFLEWVGDKVKPPRSKRK